MVGSASLVRSASLVGSTGMVGSASLVRSAGLVGSASLVRSARLVGSAGLVGSTSLVGSARLVGSATSVRHWARAIDVIVGLHLQGGTLVAQLHVLVADLRGVIALQRNDCARCLICAR